MDEYIKRLVHVIRNGAMENTYKMAWARSIVEYCCLNDSTDIIHFDELAPLIFKYYWDQTIYFDLRQGPQIKKPPVIHQLVKNRIESYQLECGYQPQKFLSVQSKINIPIREISKACKQDVCHRFPKVGDSYYDLYELDKNNLTIGISKPSLIKDYSDLLFELINYRWTQKLEEFNNVPRVSLKVRGTDREIIRRKSLIKYRKYLDIENPERLSFISENKIPINELSIDHVIPWSYMFSDDLWNLVYVNKSENSSKNNRLPDETSITKLEKRNKRLLKLVRERNVKSNDIEDLKLSISKDYVRSYWISYKG